MDRLDPARIHLSDHGGKISSVRQWSINSSVRLEAKQGSMKNNEVDSIRNRFLLLDSRIIAGAKNAQLVVGTVRKHKANPLFEEDKPWEKRFDNFYGNVIDDKEEKIYKCWYSPFIVDHSARGMTRKERDSREYRPPSGREMGICYATSRDGIRWEKPKLCLVEYDGSKENNIVWRGPHGAGIFRDERDPDAGRRYKIIFQGLKVSVSPDGLNWPSPRKCEGVRVKGDTHNNALWAPTLGKHVGFTRTKTKEKGRQVARIESADYVNWTAEEVVLEGESTKQQTYAMPVFFHGGVYLGLIALFDTPSGRVWTELAWSPDTKEWHRLQPGTPLIPCSKRVLDYDYGGVYACAYPVFLDNEIRLYYGGSDYYHSGWRNGSLCLAVLRPDGFAGYEQKSKEKAALLTTTAIPYGGQEIRITADVNRGGSIEVSVVDGKGQDVVTAGTVSKTVTDVPLKWSKKIGADMIRLKFEIVNAKLYSFSLAE